MGLGEDVQVGMVGCRDLLKQIWMRGGMGGEGKGDGRQRGRGGKERWRRRCRRGGGGGRGGGGEAGSGAKRGVEGEHTDSPVDARVVTHQPGKSQDQFEVAQPHHVSGKDLGVMAMDA